MPLVHDLRPLGFGTAGSDAVGDASVITANGGLSAELDDFQQAAVASEIMALSGEKLSQNDGFRRQDRKQ